MKDNIMNHKILYVHSYQLLWLKYDQLYSQLEKG